MAYYYIKLYHEVLDDPKMGELPDNLWRRCIELFLVAGRSGRDGKLPPLKTIAWMLRIPAAQLRDELQSLANVGIITIDGDNHTVTNFEKRQDAETGAERSKRYRDANAPVVSGVTNTVTNRRENVTVNVAENATNAVTNDAQELRVKVKRESDIELKETEQQPHTTDQQPPTPAPAAAAEIVGEIYKIYESEIGIITPKIAELMGIAIQDYSTAWIIDAIHEGVRHNARNWSYVEAILRRWKSTGRDGKSPGKLSKSATPEDTIRARLATIDPNSDEAGKLRRQLYADAD